MNPKVKKCIENYLKIAEVSGMVPRHGGMNALVVMVVMLNIALLVIVIVIVMINSSI
jgi:hypothetical protein